MSTVREQTAAPSAKSLGSYQPFAGTQSISGVRIYDVGQGDAVAVLDETKVPRLWIDHGGRQGNPFRAPTYADPDQRLPVGENDLVMLTHWDEDHWCTARKGQKAIAAKWLVPRQTSSPRAARFSATVDDIACLHEPASGTVHEFRTAHGDRVCWEKIGDWPGPKSSNEDCNSTGIAFSIKKIGTDGSPDRIILLPGDAPLDKIPHYQQYRSAGSDVIAVVAFHHGAGTHWTQQTEKMVSEFEPAEVIFSCADPNAYSHPDRNMWRGLLGQANFVETAALRRNSAANVDILF